MKTSQDSCGAMLERQTDQLLRLFPGANVQSQVELGGKKVDILFVTSAHLMPDFTVAVECKEWSRPLTRKHCAAIIAEYATLLADRLIDQFLLITRRGIVPSARKLFDNRKRQHLTFSQLGDRILNPLPLVENTRRYYLNSALGRTYVPQRGFSLDLQFASRNFDLLYNDFIDLAIDLHADTLPQARTAWQRYSETSSEDLFSPYSDQLFRRCYQQRVNRQLVDLTDLFLSWIDSTGESDALALLGGYGTGKSSFARRLAFLQAERHLQDPLQRVPFLIELKEFGSHQDIQGLITHELVNRHGVANGSFELFNSLNAAGRFVIILDGFDEMKQGMTVDSLLYNFHQLAKLSTGKSKVILCGRPTLFENRTEQNRVMSGALLTDNPQRAKYIQVEIAPFSPEESCQFLESTARNASANVCSFSDFRTNG